MLTRGPLTFATFNMINQCLQLFKFKPMRENGNAIQSSLAGSTECSLAELRPNFALEKTSCSCPLQGLYQILASRL